MKKDRFLIFILIGIAIMVVIAVFVFFGRSGELNYSDSTEPEGVVRNYIVALHKQDMERAYSYLADIKNKPTFTDFRAAFLRHEIEPQYVGVEFGETTISGENANVEIGIIYSSTDPFNSGARSGDYAQLVLQQGNWKITQMPYALWAWEWYQPLK